MLGKKPDPTIREPFLWDKMGNDSLRTEWMEPKFSKDKTVQSLSVQMKTENSLWKHYQKWINFRNNYEVLTQGELEEFENQNPALLTFIRVLGNDKLNVIHNLSANSQDLDTQFSEILIGKENVQNNRINAYSTIVFK
jgi:glycosidase